MPGSLLMPHDALSDRSEASYGSTDSRASAKKVSFNKAVRVKQYPGTPDYGYSNEDGQNLSSPGRRFWFRVYKAKPRQDNGDHWKHQNGSTYNDHSTYSVPTTSWEEDAVADTYDSLAPIVEDDCTDLDDRRHLQRSKRYLDDQHTFGRSRVKDTAYKIHNGTSGQSKTQNGVNDHIKGEHPHYYTKHSKDTKPITNGFNTFSKSQSKPKFERKEFPSQRTSQNDKGSNYRSLSQPKYTPQSTSNYSKYPNPERYEEQSEKSELGFRIPRAESPLRGRDSIERFSMRYKTHNSRRSRSTDDANHSESRIQKLASSDKSVSTDNLHSSGHPERNGLSWATKANKDKSTQCNGTLIRSKPLTVYGTPRLSRSLFLNSGDEKSGENTNRLQNGNFKRKTDVSVNDSRSYCFGCHSTTENGRSTGEALNQFESSKRHFSSDARKNGNQIITKPQIAVVSSLTPNNKISNLSINDDNYSINETKYELPVYTSSLNGHYADSYSAIKSAGLYERGHGLSVVPEERSPTRQQWSKNTPLVERRTSNWERNSRPAAATVGYQAGRNIETRRLRYNGDLRNNFESESKTKTEFLSRSTERNQLPSSTRDDRSYMNNSDGSVTRTPPNVPLSSNGQDVIDWTQSGFQLGPPTVDRDLVSDSECLVHQRAPLLMYIPGVSHHEKPAVEVDRMSGISGLSRADTNDDLKKPKSSHGFQRSYIFSRRNSMPKDSDKGWGVKWKMTGKPSRQP